MRKSAFLLAFIMISALSMLACRNGAPVENPTANIATSRPLSQQEVRSAILTACPQTGWVAREVSPNTIEATITVRNKHTAVADIVYSATQYTINYKSSSNLEAQDGKIHPNYNNWVLRLRNNINLQLAAIANK